MSRVAEFYGANDIDRMFTDQAPMTPNPFPRAIRLKNRQDYDQERVNRAVANPTLKDIDVRTLSTLQGNVTRAGVRHYMGSDEVFKDAHQAGNAHPVVYSRHDPERGQTENLLLSGNHRAAAALLQGKQLKVNHVEGPWGPDR